MTVDKPYLNGFPPSTEGIDQKLARLNGRRNGVSHGASPAGQSAPQRLSAPPASDPVQVSSVSRELSAALGATAMDEVFDQDKVESIRREIREGRFPIDEERLAKKFRELEKELGDLGA